MKNSIVTKIFISIIIIQIVSMSIINIITYTEQKEIINKIMEKKKTYAINKIEQQKTYAINKELEILKIISSSVSGAVSDAMYNIDNSSAELTIEKFFKRENIKAVYCFDTSADTLFSIAYKEKSRVVFSSKLPKKFEKFKYIRTTLVADSQNIGYMNIYYDNSKIINKLKQIQKDDLDILENENAQIDNDIQELLYHGIISFIIGGLLIILTIVILINTLVRKPLYEFQKGLNSFFDYLKDPTKEVKSININTKDEFGQMTKSVNKSIEVSVLLHQDIKNKNIIAQELNRELEESEHELQLFNESLESKIEERTKDLEETKKQVEAIYKHTRDSIEYASLIQGALIPQKGAMEPFFKDHFVTWIPKDTVGGDIWLFNKLRHEDECLLLFIDCTGHGVPGAFVTMIVKAVEREVISKIKADRYNDIDVSPAWIMGYFNKTIKTLLRQETKDSLSNAGWDGGIIYYNRRTQILKFAGAETPLFYTMPDGEFKTVKGNRYSVGYKKCDANYEYKETTIEVEEGMKFYCTTDGYLDQNGGAKDFPFGKKRFGNIIKEHYEKPMIEQQTIFINEMEEYETMIPDNDRNDDMTVIAFEIGSQSDFVEDIVEEIVKYEGVMTQNVIASCMDNIEVKITNMGMMGTVSTITIEYCQNMMNYSKNEDIGSRQIVPAGIIEVQYINNEYYDIMATNIVSIEDKEKIEPKLIEIQGLDKAGIKKRYRELRKSGQNTHEKGGGIGMYEIAKVSDSIEYNFEAINEDKYRFTMKSFVKPKARKEK